MRKIYSLLVVFGLLFSGCDSYFDEDLHQSIPAETAYNTVEDISNNLTGAYYALGTYRFQGMNIAATGDLASDNCLAGASSGHYVGISTYTYSETSTEFSEMWSYGYQVIDRTTRLINGAKALLAKGGLSEAQIETLNSAISESYALRAYSAFMLVNLYGLPYGTDSSEHGGIIIAEEKPIEPKERVSRSSVQATYEWILRDIAKANEMPSSISSDEQYYFNPAAVKALEARVNLYMKNYGVAKTAAQQALTLRGADSKPVSPEYYLSMWSSTAISNEDIFTIVKSSDDNLSANALNTLYSTYKSALTSNLIAQFNEKDIRQGLIDGTHPKKFDGTPGAQAVSNIPVFRVSEMYLIIAEACAATSAINEAQTALFFTAQRDKAITEASQLPSTKEELLKFISVERRREFFTEGHRWFDARRTGEKIDLNNGNVKKFNISALVFPIPSTEINSGYGCEQNPTWSEAMPD